jgi:formate-dependent nitrite reductase membrane component NrfD
MQETRIPTELSPADGHKRFSMSTIVERLATLSTGYTPDPDRELQEPTYYDRPVLKAPVWHWEIIWYLFFGGLAAGCYIIATIASLSGSRENRAVVRTGYYLSLLALLPCPLLLIKDLGRPERFLHMLRLFKVKSPMSMGTWSLVTFSLFSGTTALIQAARDGLLGRWWGARFLAALPQKLIAFPGTTVGFFLGSYTGVLLTATSVPLWSRSKLLGGIFLTSALSTSSALISFVLRLTNAPRSALHKLERLEWAALLIEMTGILAFLRGTGRAVRTWHDLLALRLRQRACTAPAAANTLAHKAQPAKTCEWWTAHLPTRAGRRLFPAPHHDRGRPYVECRRTHDPVEREKVGVIAYAHGCSSKRFCDALVPPRDISAIAVASARSVLRARTRAGPAVCSSVQ